MSKIARMAINNLNKSGLLDDDDTATSVTKGFMGNKKPKATVGDDPTSTVAHFVKLVKKQRKELTNANS